MSETIIKVDSIKKSFNDKFIFKDISFEIKKGEVVCLLGPSGAGKTTLLRCLNFLERADEGNFNFLGTSYNLSNIKNKDISNIRKHTSFVFQDYNLFINKNALENVIEGLIVARKMNKKEATDLGKKLLDKVGLLDKADSYPSRLSGGEKQRVAIARALATNPQIIYFDEPTSALDPQLTQEVLNVIKDLANEGATMLIVTHEMSFAKNVAHKIMLMDKGSIIENTTANDFFNNTSNETIKKFLNI